MATIAATAARAPLAALAAAVVLTALSLVPGGPGEGRARAQEAAAPITIDVTVAPADGTGPLTVGDRVTVTVTVTHPADLLVTLRPPEPAPALAVIAEAPPETAAARGAPGRAVTRFGLTLAAFTPGPVTPGGATVRWVREDGRTGALPVDLPVLSVEPTLPPGMTALHPLPPPRAAGDPPPWWGRPRTLAAVGGGAALLAAGAWAAAAVQGARRRRARRPAPPDRAPEVEALQALHALQGVPALLATGAGTANGDGADGSTVATYYAELGGTVRRYLARRYGAVAAALTTAELSARMGALGVERWQARLVSGLLARCDGAVYAGYRPDPASCAHDLDVAIEIVALGDPAAPGAAADGPPDGTRGGTHGDTTRGDAA